MHDIHYDMSQLAFGFIRPTRATQRMISAHKQALLALYNAPYHLHLLFTLSKQTCGHTLHDKRSLPPHKCAWRVVTTGWFHPWVEPNGGRTNWVPFTTLPSAAAEWWQLVTMVTASFPEMHLWCGAAPQWQRPSLPSMPQLVLAASTRGTLQKDAFAGSRRVFC